MARGLYQYETSPRKLAPSYKPRKKQSIKVLENPKANKKTLQSHLLHPHDKLHIHEVDTINH